MPVETRREREKAMHRREILEAAKRVFAQKGFSGTTVDDIAQEAEFSKGAMYVYFNSKEDLFLSLIQEKEQDLETRLQDLVQRSEAPDAKIRDLVHIHLRFFEEDRSFFQILAAEQPRLEVETGNRIRQRMREVHARYMDLVEKVMQEGISAGVLKPMPPRVLATGIMGIIHSFTIGSILREDAKALTEMEPVIMELFIEGAGQATFECSSIPTEVV